MRAKREECVKSDEYTALAPIHVQGNQGSWTSLDKHRTVRPAPPNTQAYVLMNIYIYIYTYIYYIYMREWLRDREEINTFIPICL